MSQVEQHHPIEFRAVCTAWWWIQSQDFWHKPVRGSTSFWFWESQCYLHCWTRVSGRRKTLSYSVFFGGCEGQNLPLDYVIKGSVSHLRAMHLTMSVSHLLLEFSLSKSETFSQERGVSVEWLFLALSFAHVQKEVTHWTLQWLDGRAGRLSSLSSQAADSLWQVISSCPNFSFWK